MTLASKLIKRDHIIYTISRGEMGQHQHKAVIQQMKSAGG